MNDQRHILREIDWQSLCPWLILVRALHLAIHGRVLLLATAGLLTMMAGHRVGDPFFAANQNDTKLEEWQTSDHVWPTWKSHAPIPKNVTGAQAARPKRHSLDESGWLGRLRSFLEFDAVGFFSRPFVRLFDGDVSGRSVAHALFCGIWSILVWSLFGGAITRIGALYLTRGELLGMRSAMVQTFSRLTSYIAAPLLPLALIVVLSIPILAAGAITSVSWITAIASGLWIFSLMIGVLLAILAVGLLIGWPFMWATLSVERTDAFDAFSRSFSYVYQRPLKLFFYVCVSSILNLLGSIVVFAFASMTIGLSDLAFQMTAGADRLTEFDGRSGVQFWKSLVAAVTQAFPIAYVWTSSVAIYLLMRRDIDSAEMDEVALEEQDDVFGLPNLIDHPSGVPSVEKTESSGADDSGTEGEK